MDRPLDLPPYRVRIARLMLSIATLVGLAMILALPIDVYTFGGTRGETISFLVLLALIIGSVWGHVELALRHRTGQWIALALGAYALLALIIRGPLVSRAVTEVGAPGAVWSLAIAGAAFLALVVAGLACLPTRGAPEAPQPPAV